VSARAYISHLARDVHAEYGLTTLVLTHDTDAMAEIAGEVAVTYGGRIAERGPVQGTLAGAA
jgi:peptide/nickel transport system ATP-binding protein